MPTLSAPTYQPINFYESSANCDCNNDYILQFDLDDDINFLVNDTEIEELDDVVTNGNFEDGLSDWDTDPDDPIGWELVGNAINGYYARAKKSNSSKLVQDLDIGGLCDNCDSFLLKITVVGLNPDGFESVEVGFQKPDGTGAVAVLTVTEDGTYAITFNCADYVGLEFTENLYIKTIYDSNPPATVNSNVKVTGIEFGCYSRCVYGQLEDAYTGEVICNFNEAGIVFDEQFATFRQTGWSVNFGGDNPYGCGEIAEGCYRIRIQCGENFILSAPFKRVSIDKCKFPLIKWKNNFEEYSF